MCPDGRKLKEVPQLSKVPWVAGQMPLQVPIVPSWRIWLQPTTPRKGAPTLGLSPLLPGMPPTPTVGWDIN